MNTSEKVVTATLVTLAFGLSLALVGGITGAKFLLLGSYIVCGIASLPIAVSPLLIWREVEGMRIEANRHYEQSRFPSHARSAQEPAAKTSDGRRVYEVSGAR